MSSKSKQYKVQTWTFWTSQIMIFALNGNWSDLYTNSIGSCTNSNISVIRTPSGPQISDLLLYTQARDFKPYHEEISTPEPHPSIPSPAPPYTSSPAAGSGESLALLPWWCSHVIARSSRTWECSGVSGAANAGPGNKWTQVYAAHCTRLIKMDQEHIRTGGLSKSV